jgi:hypothetical protein
MERECGVLLAVDGAVRAELAKVANGAHELEDLMGCELGPGHAGPHEALGQTAGDGTDYWLRWSDGEAVHVKVLEPCEVESDSGDFCLLPSGHPGAHRF